MNTARSLMFDDIRKGDRAAFEHTVSLSDVETFADLSGDHNPLHVDETYASTTPFGTRVVHGMFLGALVSRLVGMHLPGKQALLLKESIEFKKPVHIGETVEVEGVVSNASPSTRIVEMGVRITVGGIVVAEGSIHAQVRE